MRVVAIIQARLNSSRFPRKTLADIGGKPLIAHVVERVKCVEGLADLALAVPYSESQTFRGLNIAPIYEGPPDDVLTRFATTARHFAGIDAVLRITGDCALWCPDVGAKLLDGLDNARHIDYYSNDVDVSGYPDGFDVELISMAALLDADRYAFQPYDREHVTPWIRRYARKCFTMYARDQQHSSALQGLKLSVDTQEDLDRVRKVYDALDDKTDFSFAATIRACAKVGLV